MGGGHLRIWCSKVHPVKPPMTVREATSTPHPNPRMVTRRSRYKTGSKRIFLDLIGAQAVYQSLPECVYTRVLRTWVVRPLLAGYPLVATASRCGRRDGSCACSSDRGPRRLTTSRPGGNAGPLSGRPRPKPHSSRPSRRFTRSPIRSGVTSSSRGNSAFLGQSITEARPISGRASGMPKAL